MQNRNRGTRVYRGSGTLVSRNPSSLLSPVFSHDRAAADLSGSYNGFARVLTETGKHQRNTHTSILLMIGCVTSYCEARMGERVRRLCCSRINRSRSDLSLREIDRCQFDSRSRPGICVLRNLAVSFEIW